MKKLLFSWLQPLRDPTLQVMFAGCLFLFYWMDASIFSDPDSPWHLAAGNLILDSGKIPPTNLWSFAAAEYPWYNLAWLWDLMISAIGARFGTAHIFTFCILLKSITICTLYASIRSRKRVSFDPLLISCTLVALCLLHYAGCRPQLMTYLMVVIFHHILHHHRHNLKTLLWLPVLMIPWVNMHGGYVAGFILVGTYGLVALLEKDWALVKILFGIGCAMALAALANPWGIGIYTGVLDILVEGKESTETISEWQPLTFSVYVFMDAYLVFFLMSGTFTDKKLPLADKILAGFWLVSGLYSLRHIAIFTLLSAPLFAQRLEVILKHKVSHNPIMRLHTVKRFGLLIAALALAISPLRDLRQPDNTRLMEAALTPSKEIEYIQQHNPHANVLNAYSYGGQLIYFGKGELKVLHDGRAGTAYSPEALKYMFDPKIPANIDEVIQKYDLHVALLQKSSNLPCVSALGWHKAFEGPVADVWMRDEKPQKQKSAK